MIEFHDEVNPKDSQYTMRDAVGDESILIKLHDDQVHIDEAKDAKKPLP